MKSVSKLLMAAMILLCAARLSPAQTTRREPEVHKLTVHPAAVADRALKYRLTPTYYDQTPGNAATVYMAAMMVLDNQPPEWMEKVERLQDLPVDQIPKDEARALLKDADSMFTMLRIAGQREFCQWDLTRREQVDMALLPHLHRMRSFAHLLSLNTRVAVLEGRFDDAVDSLRISFAMAQNCQANDATILDGLVSSGMDGICLQDVAAFISMPNAPNIYWAMANLPRPMVDVRNIVRRERAYFFRMYPELKDPRGSNLSDQRWQEIEIRCLNNESVKPPTPAELEKLTKEVAKINAVLLPKAKAYLKSIGTSDKDVEATPAAQTMAIYAVADMEKWRDEREKWFGLPFWQAKIGLMETDKAIIEMQANEPNPLISRNPNTMRVAKKLNTPDRDCAAIMTIEAIRAYASANDGKSPPSLAELTLPVPADPATGEPMQYAPGDGGFTLISNLPTGDPGDEIRYEVTLK